jgi:Spherulation-specific family 4
LLVSGVVWSTAYTAPTSGTVTFTVRACNASGCGPFASTTYTATAGTTAPPVTIAPPVTTAPTAGTVPSAPGVVNYAAGSGTVAWSSPASSGSSALSRYELFANGAQVALTGTQPNIWSAIYAAPTSGSVTFTVRACNASGCGPFASTTYTATAGTTVAPGTTTPGVPGGAPSAPTPMAYYPTTGGVAWTSPSSVGTTSITKYELYANGSLVTSGLVFSATYPAPTSGSVTFTARACNASGCGPYASISYTAPPTPPTPAGVGQGVIIPAYYPIGTAQPWTDLAAAALQMKNASNTAVKDFWVTANFNNGPFTGSDWVTAKSRFDPIRNNGGKIFGYVHTHSGAYVAGTPVQKAQFRTLAAMQADITAWVNGYATLDGIWIDEFYPRHELATDGVQFADFPNGTAAAPTGFRTAGMDLFSTGQVTPTGGWDDVLFKWIRATYPQLKIIGNAGGQLYSNQMKYGALPDVLVSFEQTYATASATSWSALKRNDPAYATPKQAALVHGASAAQMPSIVTQARAAGFTHILATDGIYNNNLWFANPSYLTGLLTELNTAVAPVTTVPPVTTAPPTTAPPTTGTPTTIPTPAGGVPSEPTPINYYESGSLAWGTPAIIGATSITVYEAYANGVRLNPGSNNASFNIGYALPAVGATVTFTVRACNSNGCGAFGTKVYTRADTSLPSAPNNPAYDPNTKLFTWTSPTSFGLGNFTAYEAYAGAQLINNQLTFSASYPVPAGTTVAFTVRLCTLSGCGPFASTSYTAPGTPVTTAPPVTTPNPGTTSPPVVPADPFAGIITLMNQSTNQCVLTNGMQTAVGLGACSAANAKLEFVPQGASNYLIKLSDGGCLAVDYTHRDATVQLPSSDKAAAIWNQTCTGGGHQLWKHIDIGGGQFRIQPNTAQPYLTQGCLNANSNLQPLNGAAYPVIEYQCQGSAPQESWKPTSAGGTNPPPGSGTGTRFSENLTSIDSLASDTCISESNGNWNMTASSSNGCTFVFPTLAPGGYKFEIQGRDGFASVPIRQSCWSRTVCFRRSRFGATSIRMLLVGHTQTLKTNRRYRLQSGHRDIA